MLPTTSFALSPSLFFFLFFLFAPCQSRDNEIYTNCAPRPCGNMTADNISYPFWFEGQPKYCGDPKFKLNCTDDGSPTIYMLSERFVVESMDPERRTLTLVDEDLAGDTCSTPSANTTIDSTAFNFSDQDLNLTLYYECRVEVPLDYRYFFPLPCDPTVADTYAFFTLFPHHNASFASCKVAVITLSKTVSSLLRKGTPLPADAVPSLFRDAVQTGFEVTWEPLDISWCEGCTRSSGRCGYNPDDPQQRVCLCRDQPHQDTCEGPRIKLGAGNKKYKGVAIGVGVGAAGFVVLFLFLFFFCRRIRRRITSFSSDKPSRTISTDPYSKSELGNGVDTQLFSYKELQEATNNFDSSKELGDGGFGTVYRGKLKDGRAVAVKRLFENNYKRAEQFKNEIEILSRLRHPNLVTLYGCCSRHSRELLLVYEYVPNGTIADHLHGDFAKPGVLGWPTRLGIALEVADALAYLHKVEIIHRDVKTNNILLDKSFHVKVADFGLSRFFPLDVTHVSTAPQGTPGYVDPEYHRCYQLTYKSDVYSFGVVLIELISSMPAVDITRHHNEINLASLAINKIRSDSLHELVDPTLGFNSDFAVRKMIAAVAELAFRCLQEEKEARPTMEEVSAVLREVETQEYKADIIEAAVTPADEAALLKGRMPPSPVTVTAAWMSSNTTPNISG